MAVNLVSVTGSLETLSGATPMLGRMWFKLNRSDWNLTGDIFAPEYVEAVANAATGAFTVALQSTTGFQTGATYSAILRYREPLDGKDREYTVGTFALPPGGPFELGDLLAVPIIAPVPADILALCQAYAASASINAASSLINANAAAVSAVEAALYGGVEVDTFAALLALTSANAPAVSQMVRVKDSNSVWKRVASAGHLTLFATALFWELQDAVVTPEMFGATGGNATVDTPALVAAAATRRPVSLGSKSYRTTQPVTFYNLVFGIAGTEFGGNPVARILSVATMDYVVRLVGTNSVARDFGIHGSFAGYAASAKDGLLLEGANLSQISNVTVEFCRRHGIAFSKNPGDNNNFVHISGGKRRWNGRIDSFNFTRVYPTAGLYRPANVNSFNLSGTVGTNTLTLNAPWVPANYEIEPDHSILWVGDACYAITAVTSTTISVSPALVETLTAVGFSVHTGSNLHIPHHTDNNKALVTGGINYGAAGFNIWDQAAAPGTYVGNGLEWGGIGNYCFGHPSNVYGKSLAPSISGGYTEQGSRVGGEIFGMFVTDMHIDAMQMSQSLSRGDATGNIGGSVVPSLIRLVNGSTIKSYAQKAIPDFRAVTNAPSATIDTLFTSWRQVSGSVDFDAVLPAAPICGVLTPETYTVALSDIGGKVCTVKAAAAGTLVNGVAGTIGVRFRGNYRKLTCTWNNILNGWTVSAPPSLLYETNAIDPGLVSAGASATTTVVVPGAAVGDLCRASFSLDSQMVYTARVLSAGIVAVTFHNNTAAGIDLGPGTLTVEVTDVT